MSCWWFPVWFSGCKCGHRNAHMFWSQRKHSVVEVHSFQSNMGSPVQTLLDNDGVSFVYSGLLFCFQLKPERLELDRVVVVHLAFRLNGKYRWQSRLQIICKWAMHINSFFSTVSKSSAVVWYVIFVDEFVGIFNCLDVCKSHLFYQSILERLKQSFNPPFGFW